MKRQVDFFGLTFYSSLLRLRFFFEIFTPDLLYIKGPLQEATHVNPHNPVLL